MRWFWNERRATGADLPAALGVRVHGAYLPMRLPNSGDEAFDNDRYVMNTYAFDLNLVLRPFAGRGGSPWMSSLYLFAGGGGPLVVLTGEDRPLCEGTLSGLGAPRVPRGTSTTSRSW